MGLGWSKLTGEPEPDPFHMTLLVSSVDANATPANEIPAYVEKYRKGILQIEISILPARAVVGP